MASGWSRSLARSVTTFFRRAPPLVSPRRRLWPFRLARLGTYRPPASYTEAKMGKKSKSKRRHAPKGPQGVVESTPSASVKLNVGDRVTLQGLKAAEFNGKLGKVVSLPKSNDPDGRYGILPDGRDSPVAVRPKNIDVVRIRKSTEQMRKEREESVAEYARCPGGEYMNADRLATMRMMSNMFMTEELEVKIFGRKIEPMPDFCRELKSDCGGFPTGVDEKWGSDYLRTAYEQSNNLPHYFEMYIKQPGYKPSAQDLLKRLGTNDPEKLRWYCSSMPGAIFPRTRQAQVYSSLLRHSYSNQAYRKEALHLGTTHVAVGFVDLGILFAATLRESPEATSIGPLRFLGVEMSPYAVAKTLVVWEMLKQTPSSEHRRDAHLRGIMQVWFSSTWGEGTADAVGDALSALCSPSGGGAYHPDVGELLRHWYDASIMPVEEARSQLARSTSNARSCIGCLRRKCDRVAMAKYEITGDFGVRGEPRCGNTLMFDCPDGTPPLARDETAFSVLHWADIAEILFPRSNVVEAAEGIVLTGISKLADWALGGLVTVELVCAKFEDVIQDIAAAKPWTMSWSNVIDYVSYDDFHRMARACSVHGDTIHFGYSMNWVVDVFGVNIVDYQGEQRAELRANLIDTANQAVKETHKALGWDKYLRLPPPVNPINTTAHYGLEILHYKEWVQYFFDIAKCSGPCEVANSEHAVDSLLSPTGASTVAFTWTYDPEIKFNALL